MAKNSPSQFAFTTQESSVVGISHIEQKHPLYGTPSYEVSVEVDIVNGQRHAIQDVLSQHEEICRPLEIGIRSAIAQGGVEAGDPKFSSICIRNGKAYVDTLLTDWLDDPERPFFETVLSLAAQSRLKLLSLMYLPEQAKRFEVQTRFQPKQTFGVGWHRMPQAALEAALEGRASARQLIAEQAFRIEDPGILSPGSFYLGKLWNPPMNGHLGVLSRKIKHTKGRTSYAVHGSAIRFDAGRSDGKRRAIEVYVPEDTGHVDIADTIYTVEHFCIADDRFSDTRGLV